MNWPFSLWHNHFHSSQAESFSDLTKLILFKVKSVLDEQPMDIEALHLRFQSFFYFSITSHHIMTNAHNLKQFKDSPILLSSLLQNNIRSITINFNCSIKFHMKYYMQNIQSMSPTLSSCCKSMKINNLIIAKF